MDHGGATAPDFEVRRATQRENSFDVSRETIRHPLEAGAGAQQRIHSQRVVFHVKQSHVPGLVSPQLSRSDTLGGQCFT